MAEIMNRFIGGVLPPEDDILTLPVGDYYLLAIAIDQYKAGKGAPTPLNNTVLDATRIVDKLIKEYGGREIKDRKIGFDAQKTKTLYDADATKKNILDWIENTLLNKNKNDVLLIYYAGHGEYNTHSQELIIYPYDAVDGNKFGVYELYKNFKDYVGKEEHEKKFRDILLVLDCCFSEGAKIGYVNLRTNDFSRRILVSTGQDRLAADGVPGEGSPFANAFLRALDEEPNSVFGISAIAPKLANIVKAATGKGKLMPQIVSIGSRPGDDDGKGDFYFIQKSEILKPSVLVKRILYEKDKQLNFTEQRSILPATYDDTRNWFNVFICAGKDSGAKDMLGRLCLDHHIGSQGAVIPLSGLHVYEIPYHADGIWSSLFANFELTSLASPRANFFGQLLEKCLDGYENQIKSYAFWIDIGKQYTPVTIISAANFCWDFYEAYKASIENLKDLNERERIKKNIKIVIFIAYEKDNNMLDLSIEKFGEIIKKLPSDTVMNKIEKVKFLKELNINIIPNPVVEPMTEQEIRDWLNDHQDIPDFVGLSPEKLALSDNGIEVSELVAALFDKCKIPSNNDPITEFFSINKIIHKWK